MSFALRDLRRCCRDVAAILDGMGASRALRGEEALIEMAVLAQSHEHTLDEMWAALARCEQVAHLLEASETSPTLPSEREAGGPTLPARPQWPTDPRFTVRPPPAPLADRAEEEPDSTTQVDAGPRRVLLVDDDPAVLRAFRRVLSATHEVMTARDGSEALRVVLGDAPLHAIICDISMPKLDGPTFFGELFELRPQLMPKVVFCTGGAPGEKVTRFLGRIRARLLHKPVSANALLRAVESVRAG